MQFTIDKLLAENDKTRYWLAKNIDVTYPTIMKICNNDTVSVKLETIEKICKVFNCTPNDILKIEDQKNN